MSNTKTKLTDAMKQAMRDKNQVVLSTVRFMLSEIKNIEIDSGELAEEKIITVIQKEIEKLDQAAKQFESAGRSDLVEENKAQIEVLKQFVPTQLSEQELEPLIKQFIDSQESREFKDLVRPAIQQFSSQASGKSISSVLQRLLSE